ncbi:hypothetical protein FSP39_006944 [Pinctada imbricata]|uniref:non-specific serine/threonine protein kinase n=1 Tax=Pinctada imbricata TaxID=66713 RepID=A0AA88XQL1_PINIB|nr:hypothetical protein FSP39_006944 [Pinctada imbricata]
MSSKTLIKQGAEAKLYSATFHGRPCIVKERFKKSYRHPSLDQSLTNQRIKSEVRALLRSRMNGVRTPTVYFVDLETSQICMEEIRDSVTVRDYIMSVQKSQSLEDSIVQLKPLGRKIGETLAVLHQNNIVHGDLTTSNMLLQSDPMNLNLVMIDFGLSHFENLAEDKGVDLYVLERAILSTHPNSDEFFSEILDSYTQSNPGSADVIAKLDEVRMRGRKRTMVG